MKEKYSPLDLSLNSLDCLSRRGFLRLLAGTAAGLCFNPVSSKAAPITLIKKAIPKTGEQLPVIGMGSWLTFNLELNEDNSEALATRVKVLQAFFDRGGAIIDSSPMYGNSQDVIGYCLKHINNKDALFAATKVWTLGRRLGIFQMESSQKRWGVKRFDLMQIHNMLDWKVHLQTLQQWKEEGRIRYMGITTSHGRRHEKLEQALKQVPFDFVQFTYNIVDREVEQRLLPLAADRGMAVIINRPFKRGDLFDHVEGKSLPPWAAEFDCQNWAQFFLKYIVSHPYVNYTIPATRRVDHMQQNMGACYGRLPDAKTRTRMADYFRNL